MSWIPQSVRTYDGEHITAAEAGRPEVQLALMRRQRDVQRTVAAAVVPMVFLVLAILWNHSDHQGLAIWAVALMTNTIGHRWFHLRRPIEQLSMPALALAHVSQGICWAMLPLIAMPRQPEWQAMVGTVLIAVMATSLVTSSQFAVPFTGWLLTLCAGSIASFLMLQSNLGIALSILLAIGGGTSLLLGAVLRAADLSAIVVAARNADLVDELQLEKQRLQGLAHTDPLTGIGNRLAFSHDLAEVLEAGDESVVLALIDLDDFKLVNDSLGHQAGDHVLREITSRLENALQPEERLYRLGGDELTAIQRKPSESSSPAEFGQRLLRVFGVPVAVAGTRQEIKASIGIAEGDRRHDAETLQQSADEALYRAKRAPGNQLAYFDRAMQIESARHKALLKDATRALHTGQIVPWLQPVIEMSTGAIVGAEALARWEHPDGVRAAGSFVPALEDSGEAGMLDAIVFDAVCEYQRRLESIHGGAFAISCNVSPVFLQVFLERYESTDRLLGKIIEITEQRDLTNHDELAALIKRAQDAGAWVVVDDFGTGFSSMERLSLGSFNGLKIDGGFVQALAHSRNSMAIVASIAEIGRQLQIPVVAEGVESAQHATQLLDYGIQWAQGYHYLPAVPVDELAAILERQRVHGPHFAGLAVTTVTEAHHGT